MNHNSVKCDICKIDIRRSSYSRHSKSKMPWDIISQNKVINPQRNPIKRVVKTILKYLIQKMRI